MHNRHQIVRREMAVYELLRPTLHPRRPERRCMQIVENEHIYPAGKWALVASNIGLQGRRSTSSGVSIGISTSAKPGNRLRLAVFENLKVLLPKVSHDGTTLVGDQGIDLDIFDFRLECRKLNRLLARRLRGEWRQSGTPKNRQPPHTTFGRRQGKAHSK